MYARPEELESFDGSSPMVELVVEVFDGGNGRQLNNSNYIIL